MQKKLITDGHRFTQISELDKFNSITEKIIGCAYTVSNVLGAGFLEKVYENALAHELKKAGIKLQQQQPLHVIYDGIIVGDYVADILVEDCVLVEVKAVKTFDDAHQAQCLNYLKATGLRICLLLNFGTPKVGIKELPSENETPGEHRYTQISVFICVHLWLRFLRRINGQ